MSWAREAGRLLSHSRQAAFVSTPHARLSLNRLFVQTLLSCCCDEIRPANFCQDLSRNASLPDYPARHAGTPGGTDTRIRSSRLRKRPAPGCEPQTSQAESESRTKCRADSLQAEMPRARLLASVCRPPVAGAFRVRTPVAPDELRKKPKTLALCGSNSAESERYSSRIPSAGRRRLRPRRSRSPCLIHDFSRPFGTWLLLRLNPALKGWAILDCPFGTWSGHRALRPCLMTDRSESFSYVTGLPQFGGSGSLSVAEGGLPKKRKALAFCGSNSPKSEGFSTWIPSAGYVYSVVGTSRCDDRAARSGATRTAGVRARSRLACNVALAFSKPDSPR